MTFPRARLTVAALLFAAWLGYLLLLVLVTRHTVVLSRPQFLVSDLWVLAELTGADGNPEKKAKILDLFWYRNAADLKLKGQTITIANLPDTGPQGYSGPGKYILPIRRMGPADIPLYLVTAVPPSPGYNVYAAAFVRVELRAPGTDPERTARLAAEYLGIDLHEAQERVAVVAKGHATTLKRSVPRQRALEFAEALDESSANDAPWRMLLITPNDERIYPWTPETQGQIEEMVAAQPGANATAPAPAAAPQ